MAYKVTVGDIVLHVPDRIHCYVTNGNHSTKLEPPGATVPGNDAAAIVVSRARRVVARVRAGERFGAELDALASAVDVLDT